MGGGGGGGATGGGGTVTSGRDGAGIGTIGGGDAPLPDAAIDEPPELRFAEAVCAVPLCDGLCDRSEETAFGGSGVAKLEE
jgi:hypothetical protein